MPILTKNILVNIYFKHIYPTLIYFNATWLITGFILPINANVFYGLVSILNFVSIQGLRLLLVISDYLRLGFLILYNYPYMEFISVFKLGLIHFVSRFFVDASYLYAGDLYSIEGALMPRYGFQYFLGDHAYRHLRYKFLLFLIRILRHILIYFMHIVALIIFYYIKIIIYAIRIQRLEFVFLIVCIKTSDFIVNYALFRF